MVAAKGLVDVSDEKVSKSYLPPLSLPYLTYVLHFSIGVSKG